MSRFNTIRAVSVIEVAKGAVVLLAGFGALSLIHHDVQRAADKVIGHLHLDLAKHYPRIFVDTAAHIADAHLWLLATLAVVYALVRFVEGWGLWHERPWAEWLAACSAGIYIPFEIYELSKRASVLALSALVINLLIIVLMIIALLRAHSHEATRGDPHAR